MIRIANNMTKKLKLTIDDKKEYILEIDENIADRIDIITISNKEEGK